MFMVYGSDFKDKNIWLTAFLSGQKVQEMADERTLKNFDKTINQFTPLKHNYLSWQQLKTQFSLVKSVPDMCKCHQICLNSHYNPLL